MKNFIIPIVILFVGVLFTWFTFKDIQFKPVESHISKNYVVVSKNENDYLMQYEGTKHVLFIPVTCKETFKIGQKIRLTEKFIDGRATNQYLC